MQVILERIAPPPGGVMLDAMGGGNQRSLLCAACLPLPNVLPNISLSSAGRWRLRVAWMGHDAISNDVRPDVQEEGEQRLTELDLPGDVTFTTGDARRLLWQPAVRDALGTITHSVGSWAFGLQERYAPPPPLVSPSLSQLDFEQG
eukprot:COSAG04_NODE_1198_length_7778_cov_17.966402_4_plen_146_part_00